MPTTGIEIAWQTSSMRRTPTATPASDLVVVPYTGPDSEVVRAEPRRLQRVDQRCRRVSDHHRVTDYSAGVGDRQVLITQMNRVSLERECQIDPVVDHKHHARVAAHLA